MANRKLTAYEVLGIHEQASESEIKQAYHAKALRYHPDRGGRVDDFINITTAFEILSDENRREHLGAVAAFQRPQATMSPGLGRGIHQLFDNLKVLEHELGLRTKT